MNTIEEEQEINSASKEVIIPIVDVIARTEVHETDDWSDRRREPSWENRRRGDYRGEFDRGRTDSAGRHHEKSLKRLVIILIKSKRQVFFSVAYGANSNVTGK